MNLIKFTRDGIDVKEIKLSEDRAREFEDHLMLVFTGIRRRASDIIAGQIQRSMKQGEP